MGAQMITIEVDQNTAQLLQALKEKAAAQGVTLEALLRPLVENGNVQPGLARMNLTEIDQILDELAAGGENLPPLPANFSREDIYFDHD